MGTAFMMVAAEAPTISGAISSIITSANSVMTVITGNELMFTLFCGSLVTLGCSVVRKIKKTSKC